MEKFGFEMLHLYKWIQMQTQMQRTKKLVYIPVSELFVAVESEY